MKYVLQFCAVLVGDHVRNVNINSNLLRFGPSGDGFDVYLSNTQALFMNQNCPSNLHVLICEQ